MYILNFLLILFVYNIKNNFILKYTLSLTNIFNFLEIVCL